MTANLKALVQKWRDKADDIAYNDHFRMKWYECADELSREIERMESEPRAQEWRPIEEMVNRFLSWKLPETFGPDCYVSFDREKAKHYGSWPIGTNIFTADEARAMFKHACAFRGSSAWKEINTCPDSDDLMWFCRGDTYEGPRTPAGDDADYWDYWCYAEPPALPEQTP